MLMRANLIGSRAADGEGNCFTSIGTNLEGLCGKGSVERIFDRYGAWSLLLAWAPIIGDPLCAVAGLFGLPLRRFLPPVLLGKLLYYF